jgi:hypothetical protein
LHTKQQGGTRLLFSISREFHGSKGDTLLRWLNKVKEGKPKGSTRGWLEE